MNYNLVVGSILLLGAWGGIKMYKVFSEQGSELNPIGIYVFELVVRLKRLGREFFSCDSPDIVAGYSEGGGHPT